MQVCNATSYLNGKFETNSSSTTTSQMTAPAQMFSALALLYTSPPPLDTNNCTVLTSLCEESGSALGAMRDASISCLRRFADETSDFGTRDGPWVEYAPSCVVWDGVPFGMAEPLNTISALAFDGLLCDANLSFAHTAISQLTFGTFAMHASGGQLFPQLLDQVPLYCFQMQVLHRLMVKAGKGSLPLVMKGTSYAVDTLASSCDASLFRLLEECNLDTMVPSLEAQLLTLASRSVTGGPAYDGATDYAIWASHRACLEDPAAANLGLFPLEVLAAAFGMSSAEIADEFDPFADALGLVAPGFAACAQYKRSIDAFAEAASYQGELPGTVEVHHRWHEKTVEALYYMGEFLTLLADQCSNDGECQAGSCVCDDSPHRRRALLFASTPRSTRSCKCQ